MRPSIIVILMILSAACQQGRKSSLLIFEKDMLDFGKIKKDSVLKVYFDFKNAGFDTLKFMNVSADCGCNEVNYKKEGFLPGQVGTIEVIYTPNSNNDSGIVSKNIAIRSNSEIPIKVIKIKGEVVE